MQDTELLMIRRADFLHLIQKSPQIAIKLLAVLAGRLRKTDRKIEGLALSDVTGRITQTLLQLAEEHGKPTSDGVLIPNRPTHQELANMSGTTRETVSRILKRLENQGYICHKGKDLLVVGVDETTEAV
jgi:CRP/FNR family transcriptional regulator/CRP/FNR family cyclic AMP-dependent transcriptional regulator